MSLRYRQSEGLLSRALEVIPLGTQTFSKSKSHYPLGVSPFYVARGEGSHLWDVDGNEYVDFVNSLAAVTLGYKDPDVDAAVRAQMDDGVIFSLPHHLEIDVSEKIVEMVPCAEMVRFGKNGSDATAGAVRVSRAYTGRERVAVCGYHGWQDWYIGSTPRSLGVPQCTQELTHTFRFNDVESLSMLFDQYPGQFAAVILEPTGPVQPVTGFLAAVRDLTHKHGAVLIFDETITGFRLAHGGAQEYFGVTPDLATFGKGLANGYPVSAVAGVAEVMQLMEEVFFSFTFGGELLSLAAANATMTKLQNEPVIETLTQRGTRLLSGLRALIRKHGVDAFVSTSGLPPWSFITLSDAGGYSLWELKTLFLQEMFARGILILASHNMSYAHSESDVDSLLAAYDEVLGLLADVVTRGTLADHLLAEPLVPLFKLR